MSATTASVVPYRLSWERNLDSETLRYLEEIKMRRVLESKDANDWATFFVGTATSANAQGSALYWAEMTYNKEVKAVTFALVAIAMAIQGRGMDLSESLRGFATPAQS